MTASAVAVTARAPGRVNLIGDHTDYTGGLVLPVAIDRFTTVTGTRGGDEIRLRSADDPEPAVVPTGGGAEPASIWPSWARYVAAVAAETGPTVGFTGTVATTIPVGAGLSSSAALEVAVALALGADDDGTADRPALAERLRAAEQRASGVPCGVMDQLTSLCGVDGHALLIDCGTLETTTVPIPDGVAIVLVDTGVRRALAGVPYAERVGEVTRAADLLAAGERVTDAVLARRARHLQTENQRVRAMAEALATGDAKAAGALLTEGHRSLRDDLENTTGTIDDLVDRLAATPGVHGARLTGGGWGGMVVALAAPGALAGTGLEVAASGGATVEIATSA